MSDEANKTGDLTREDWLWVEERAAELGTRFRGCSWFELDGCLAHPRDPVTASEETQLTVEQQRERWAGWLAEEIDRAEIEP